MASGPITLWQIDEETVEIVADFTFGGSKITSDGKQIHDQSREHSKKQRHYFVKKGPSRQGYSFSSSHVWI